MSVEIDVPGRTEIIPTVDLRPVEAAALENYLKNNLLNGKSRMRELAVIVYNCCSISLSYLVLFPFNPT